MIIEQNTPYAQLLKYMGTLTFNKIRDRAVKDVREIMPQSLQEILYENLNRGLGILDEEPQMIAYLYAFGKMHQAKLNYAFNQLPKEYLKQPEINIIDYGCGQALGIMCYADYLHDNDYTQQVKTITLIEPSEICLKRAALYTSMFFPNADIVTINKTFDELDETDIYCDEDIPTLHILSNVLDILDFDMKEFAELLKGQTKGYNQFVCVGPYFNYPDKDGRMEQFCSLLNGENYYNKSFDKYEFDEQNDWTANILCFVVRKAYVNNLSTKVTKAEIIKGIEDDYGVVYSKDGKMLLKCKNGKLETYSIKRGTELICDSAFRGIWGLHNIRFPDSVTIIGDNVFENCVCLKQIDFSDSITTIGNRIFVFCESLQQITIPSSVSTIGTNPFIDCRNVELKSNSSRFVVKDGFFIDQQGVIISFVGKDKIVTIPNTINTIGNYAFCRCRTIQQIDIPDSVTMIRKGAFASSTLQRINIPDTVTSIEEYVFGFCESLQQITIPKSVTKIGNDAFYWCKSIQQIHIPDSVTMIGDGAFYQCESLQQIDIPDSVMIIGRCVFWGCDSLLQISIPKGSKEKFQKMLDEELWDKLVEH